MNVVSLDASRSDDNQIIAVNFDTSAKKKGIVKVKIIVS